MAEQVRIYTASAITINRLAQLLEEQNIPSIIKNNQESGRLAGFGTTAESVELYILDTDVEKAQKVVDVFKSDNNI